MKKRMNKQLALLLAVLMLFTSIGMNAIAVVEHKCSINTDNPNYRNVVNPTCDKEGYTEYLCLVCNNPVSKGDYTSSLGHQYNKVCYELTADETSYYKYNMCTRQYTEDGVKVSECGERIYETDAKGNRTLYKHIKFINNKVTIGYNESIPYTKVATEPFASETLYECYVKVGDETVFEGEVNPYREKTVHYGEFNCIGWSTNGALEATALANLTNEACIDLKTLTSDFNKDGSKQADIALYPVFQGINLTYEVVFYKLGNEPVTNSQPVNHGECPKYSNPDGNIYKAPTKDEDLLNYYQFNGWSTGIDQTEGVALSEIESTPVYDNVYYYPTYKPVPKNFIIEFYDEEGKTVLFSKEGIHLEENFFTYKPEKGEDNPYKEILEYCLTELEKESDEEYRYTWAGWQVLCGDDSAGAKIVTVDKYGDAVFHGFSNITSNDVITKPGEYLLDNTLPDGLITELEPDLEPNLEPKKVIRLVPVFTRTLETYAVQIEMVLPDSEDSAYYKGEADVHVVDRNGQLVASGLTGSDGTFRCRLARLDPFTVTVATYDGKYIGTGTLSTLTKVPGGDDAEANVNNCRVIMELNPDYEKQCTCIHHNALLGPLVVRIFNILYSFFNVKYVCCYDMYSTIGPLLDYTA